MPILSRCCCCSLKTGTIISGALGIVFSLISFILILTTKVKVRTIVLDNLSPVIVKIIISLDLVISLIISILLIIGAVKRKTWYMLPWIFISIILAIGSLISIIYTSAEFFLNNDVFGGTFCIIFGLLIVAIHIYLWLVVLSYYQLVKEEKNRGPYGRPSFAHTNI